MTKDELTNMTRTELEERLGIMATEISALKVLALDLLKEPLQPILGLDWREIEKRHKLLATHDDAEELFQYIIATLKNQKRWVVMRYSMLTDSFTILDRYDMTLVCWGDEKNAFHNEKDTQAECDRLNGEEEEEDIEKWGYIHIPQSDACLLRKDGDLVGSIHSKGVAVEVVNALNKKEGE